MSRVSIKKLIDYKRLVYNANFDAETDVNY